MRWPVDSRYTEFDSELGRMLAVAAEDRLIALHAIGGKHPPTAAPGWRRDDGLRLFVSLRDWLARYAAGSSEPCPVPLGAIGTVFQQRVWQALQTIPHGRTVTYQDIARAIGSPSATRAVGAAVGRNPWLIIVPCHRVIGADGSLTGFAAGLDLKRRLLSIEAPAGRLFD